MTFEEINSAFSDLLYNLKNIVSDFNLYNGYVQKQQSITDDLVKKYENIENTLPTLDSLNTNVQSCVDLYSQILPILNKDIHSYSIVTDNSTIKADNVANFEFYDNQGNVLSLDYTLDYVNNKLSFDSSQTTTDVFVKITQNLENTKLFDETTKFTFDSITKINKNIYKIYLKVADTSEIINILGNRLLENSLLVNDNTDKYVVLDYGAMIDKTDGIKKLVIFIYSDLELSSLSTISFSEYLFDDEIINIELSNYDADEISNFYFSNSDRDLSNKDMIIYDKDGNPKYLFTYKIEDSKEIREFTEL